MDLSLTEEQELLQNSARDFLRQECPTTHVRAMEEDDTGYSPELWKQIAELGWTGDVSRTIRRFGLFVHRTLCAHGRIWSGLVARSVPFYSTDVWLAHFVWRQCGPEAALSAGHCRREAPPAPWH